MRSYCTLKLKGLRFAVKFDKKDDIKSWLYTHTEYCKLKSIHITPYQSYPMKFLSLKKYQQKPIYQTVSSRPYICFLEVPPHIERSKEKKVKPSRTGSK